jgi:hypothetical protein
VLQFVGEQNVLNKNAAHNISKNSQPLSFFLVYSYTVFQSLYKRPIAICSKMPSTLQYEIIGHGWMCLSTAGEKIYLNYCIHFAHLVHWFVSENTSVTVAQKMN